MPNSLIFAVILAVWAAYLIQHWIRRRDHVATARSVDRFSEAMRVLERRQSMPRADVTPLAPRSYSLSLTRPAHPDVVVKRAGSGIAPAPRRRVRSLRRPSVTVVRATLLVLGVLSLVAGVVLSATGQAAWWAAGAGVAGLLLALTLVRFSVGRQRRRAASPVRAQAAAPQATRARAARAQTARSKSARSKSARPEPVRRVKNRPDRTRATAKVRMAAPEAAPLEQPVHELRTELSVEVYDVAEHETIAAQPRSEVAPVPAEPTLVTAEKTEMVEGTWAPVAVPPPTYTLKAKATRRPSSAQPAESAQSAQAGPVLHGTAEVDRLPFDGNAMAFEEEFEDLPPVHSVG